MHRQICLLAEGVMSSALTKNEYGVMIGKKEEREETQPRAEQEASMRKRKGQKVLNESEPQEARRCKGWGKLYSIMNEVGWWVVSSEHLIVIGCAVCFSHGLLQVRFCCNKAILTFLYFYALLEDVNRMWYTSCRAKTFHPMAPLNWMEARPAGPGRKGTLKRRASCPLASRWLPSVSEV